MAVSSRAVLKPVMMVTRSRMMAVLPNAKWKMSTVGMESSISAKNVIPLQLNAQMNANCLLMKSVMEYVETTSWRNPSHAMMEIMRI